VGGIVQEGGFKVQVFECSSSTELEDVVSCGGVDWMNMAAIAGTGDNLAF
jgi:hypothetical protein